MTIATPIALPQPAAPPSDRYLRLPQVLAMIGISTRTLYRKMDDGTFPRQRALGDNSVAWLESEVVAWMRSRPVAK
ncbi:AlpA family transcriptional regulator [Methylovirgula sp. HY1]|uniref:helix-turn-helix transcriptional regulator n=1 Tax=Methylovirgula sp. HY1 TaxID=2822761 RepID=UPI001C5B8ACF|nr:AlpA family transcriptional regulator [Methylovirgula sp. HY1]QXX74277.1 hypothetical protein MHY1_01087 [Methylovirgula sp. HY1]